MNDPARLLSCAGGLMAVSGILMALSASLPLAVLLWAAGRRPLRGGVPVFG